MADREELCNQRVTSDIKGREEVADMAIEREYGKYIPVCDNCLAVLEKCDTFQDAVNCQKENGWRNVKINGVWQSRCQKCSGDYQKREPKLLDW